MAIATVITTFIQEYIIKENPNPNPLLCTLASLYLTVMPQQQSQCGLIHKLCVVGTRPWHTCVRPLPGRMLILCAERRRFRSLALEVGRTRGAKRLRVVLRTYTVSACVVYVCACYLCKTNVCNRLHLEKKKQAARCPRCEGGRAGCAAGNNRRLAI